MLNADSSLPPTQYLKCGYIPFAIDRIGLKWKCIFCKLIIKIPIQLTECGHRCCRGCYESRATLAVDDTMTCPVDDCNISFHKSKFMIDRAFKKELDQLSVTCVYTEDEKCNWSGPLQNYQEHLDQTHTHYPCDLCGTVLSSSEALANHKAKTCLTLFQECPLGSCCTSDMIPKDSYSLHLLSETHQEALAAVLLGKYDIPERNEQDQSMELSSPNHELEEQTSEKLSNLAEKVQKLNDETVKLSRDFIKLNELHRMVSQEVNHYQTAINDRNSLMCSFQSKQEEIQKILEDAKRNLEESQHISTDGTLTWRVDRVAERMSDAQSERVPSIYSPIFYSSLNGYKMRARLYLHGDGNARRTHMSLFFLLMKGDYDALLPWPFGYKVTFCLLDQTGTSRHIIDSFRPDVKSSSFQRPQNDANIASGIPKFFPLPMIQQDDNLYVRDDTLFIKVIVDLNDTKPVLPFMLTLNPGLPYHVQQSLINQEKNKRDQQNATGTTGSNQIIPMNTYA